MPASKGQLREEGAFNKLGIGGGGEKKTVKRF
jgi:hypothetical protein